MAELTTVRRYLYWSDRRVCDVAQNNDISLSRRWIWTLRSPLLGFLPQLEARSQRRNLSRHAIAERLETAIGVHAVSDFVHRRRWSSLRVAGL